MIEILKNVLNEDVLTSELQSEIENRFNEAVEEKSKQLVEERIEEEKKKREAKPKQYRISHHSGKHII